MRDRRFVRQLACVVLPAVVAILTACAPVEKAPEPTPVNEKEPEMSGRFADWAAETTDPRELRDPWVLIQIVGPTGSREWLVAPRVVGVCKNPTADCGDTVTWRWLPPLIDGATLRIEPKEDQPDCFDPVKLPPNPSSKTVKSSCPIGPWLYNVVCISESQGECPPEPLDPRIEIQQ